MRTIGIISGKGGVGKTTLVANLGLALAETGRNIFAVDCNVTTSHLGFNFGFNFYPVTLNDVLRNKSSMSDAIASYEGLKIIPASLSVEDLSGLDISDLSSHIKSLTNADIVLLDSAPGFGREATSVLRSCDEVIFVTTPYMSAVSDVMRGHRIVSEMGIRPLGIVLNMISKKPHELTVRDVETLTKLPVISKIKFDENIQKSLALGKPVVQFNPYSSSSIEFRRLASDILGETYRPRGSKLSKFYHRVKNLFY